MKIITDCVADLDTKIQLVQSLTKKTVFVTSVEDLIARASQIAKPAVGLMYEGARPLSAESGRQLTVTAEAVFSLLVVLEQPMLHLKKDYSPIAHVLLDDLREQIHGTRSPSGHYWKWVVEAPVVIKGQVGVWLQRWSTPAQLPPKR